MKKGVSPLVLLSLLLSLVLAGFSPAASAAAAEAAAQGKYPLSPEKVTYTMLNPSSASEKWENLRLFQIMEELTNIHFTFTNTPASDYTTKQNLMLASGDLPDVLWTALENNNVQTYGVQGGLLLDYAPLVDQCMPYMMGLMKEYPLALVGVTEMNGGIYVLPKVSFTITETGETLFVRTDMLDTIGKPIPESVEELYDTLTALKAHGFSNEFAPFLPDTMEKVEVYLFPSFGEAYEPGFADAGDGKTVVFNTITDQYKRYIEYVAKLYAEGLIDPEIYSMDAATIKAKIKANNAAVTTTGTLYSKSNFASGECEVEMIPPMTSQYSDQRHMRGIMYEKIGGVSISSKAKNPEQLLQYFDIWYAGEDVIPGLDGLSTKFGLRGETWDYANPEKTLYTRFDPPAGSNLTNEEYRTQFVAPAMQPPGYAVILASHTGDSFQTMKGEQAKINLIPYWKDRFPANFLKFTNEEYDIIASKMTDINTYLTTMKGKLITGAEPMSNWDTHIATLERMGIQEVLSAYQAAYDRLNAAKASFSK